MDLEWVEFRQCKEVGATACKGAYPLYSVFYNGLYGKEPKKEKVDTYMYMNN